MVETNITDFLFGLVLCHKVELEMDKYGRCGVAYPNPRSTVFAVRFQTGEGRLVDFFQ